MLKFFVLVIFICIEFNVVHSQCIQTIKSLRVGDSMPDITFGRVLNYKFKTAKLSDFKGKLVILDFWSTTCTACIDNFPKMSSLQKVYTDKIQILLVNPHKTVYETEERVNTLIKKFENRTGFITNLPIPIFDTILNHYFPHKTMPHVVVINEKGIVIAVTWSRYLTADNINKILAGNYINIPVKDDWIFEETKPFLVNGNGSSDPSFIYRSLITGYKKDYSGPLGGNFKLNNGRIHHFFKYNSSLIDMITVAYREEFDKLPTNRWIFDVNNESHYKRGEGGRDTTNMYCYDIVIPTVFSKPNIEFSYLREDLKRSFNITVRRETRDTETWVVTATNKLQAYTKFTMREIEIEKGSIKKYYHNYPLNEILKQLNSFFPIPLIDETKITENMDIDFPDNFDMNDSNGIIEILKIVGFEVKKENRVIEVVVITDKSK